MKKTFRLEGLACTSCAAKIQEGINKLDGVNRTFVNFATAKLTIDADEDKMDKIIESTKAIIKRLEPDVIMLEQ